jgi:hypothetical protein
MKKLLLTGIAALFLITGAAQANDQLPEHMLGRWCADYNISTKGEKVYYRLDRVERDRNHCSDLDNGIVLDQEGYMEDTEADDNGECLFDKIERRDRDTYLIQTRCRDAEVNPYYSSIAQFQIIEGLLFIKWGAES